MLCPLSVAASVADTTIVHKIGEMVITGSRSFASLDNLTDASYMTNNRCIHITVHSRQEGNTSRLLSTTTQPAISIIPCHFCYKSYRFSTFCYNFAEEIDYGTAPLNRTTDRHAATF